MKTDDKPTLVKVVFRLDPGSWHGSVTESLWAEPVGPNRYRLHNVPFYAFGVSYGDVVEAREDADGLSFKAVLSPGGHSTYRILAKGRGDEFESLWQLLASEGCTFESGHPPLLAVDVPPEANIHHVYDVLEKGEAASVWSFEEGHMGHRLEDGRGGEAG